MHFFACSATGITPILCWGMYGEEAWTEACFRSVAFFAFAGEQGAKGFLNAPRVALLLYLIRLRLGEAFLSSGKLMGLFGLV